MEAKWQDTVMKIALISGSKSEWFQNLPEFQKSNLYRQAEISYKAGYDEAARLTMEYEKKSIPTIRKQERQAGMKFVADWADSPCTNHVGYGYLSGNSRLHRECPRCWQAFLKSQGIEQEGKHEQD